ncbi:MAG: MarR family winged helix-turn-helix transcriptional regulator [Chloroflexota bacterium]
MTRLTPEELSAWRAFIEGSVRVHTRIDEDLKASAGMTLFDYHVLVLLSEAPAGRLRMRDLAAALVFAPSRLTYQATRMEQKGLIKREECEDDARGLYAAITPLGVQTLRRAAPAHVASIRHSFLEALDADDLADLTRVFGKLRTLLHASTG